MTQQQSISYAFRNYGKSLFRFIRRRVSNEQDAEDILQDVWYRLISIIDSQPVEQLGAWLYRVSRNLITDRQRKQKTLALEDFAYENDDGELVFPKVIANDLMNPETEFERKYFMDVLLLALQELPEKQRQVFVWNELEGMTLQDIADKTGENIKTIISRKRYAVAQLRKTLQGI